MTTAIQILGGALLFSAFGTMFMCLFIKRAKAPDYDSPQEDGFMPSEDFKIILPEKDREPAITKVIPF